MENKYKISSDLKLFVDESRSSANAVSKETGISMRTIQNLLLGIGASELVTEKLYDYLYKKGLRLNIAKEEIYKEFYKDKVLFHGSKFGLDKINVDGSRNNCDLGSGFYLGETYNQAASFICEYNQSSVYVFSLDTTDLKIVELECDLDWMLLICYFRGTIKNYNEHPLIKKCLSLIEGADIIIAPIANNKMYYVMQQFADGEITTTQAIHSLSASGLGKQYVLKTEKAIKKLNSLERLFVSNSEKEKFIAELFNRANEIDTKLKLSKRDFKGVGQYIDELFL